MIKQQIREKALDLYNSGLSSSNIAKECGISQRSVQRILKFSSNKKVEVEKKIEGNHRVLVIPDIHAPFTKLEYIKFLKDVEKRWQCDTVVFLGDLVDIHTISRHDASTQANGTLTEYNEAVKIIKEYVKAFPKANYIMGNHCRRIMKQAASVNIPKQFLKTFQELYNLPDSWNIADKFLIDDVLYIHGEEFSQRSGILNATSITHHSTVCGHSHSTAGVFYTNSGYDELFSLYCGCLLDKDAYAFEYGKNNKYKPILGCGVVLGKDEAYFIKFKEE